MINSSSGNYRDDIAAIVQNLGTRRSSFRRKDHTPVRLALASSAGISSQYSAG